MKNIEYQHMVEQKYGKPLREVMEELCVTKDVIAREGARILGVPESTFKAWRNNFRLGPIQRLADMGKIHEEAQLIRFKEELSETDLTRPLKFTEISFEGFKELLERFIELTKAEGLVFDLEGLGMMSLEIKISMFEDAISNLDKYLSGTLQQEYFRKADFFKQELSKKENKNKLQPLP